MGRADEIRASTEGLHRRLDGGSCVNQRSLLAACDLLAGDAESGAELRLSELLELLWLLELLTVSRNLSFDGTLPQGDLDRLDERLGRLVDGTSWESARFQAIRPGDEEEQRAFAAGAALKALDDIGLDDETPVDALAGLDRPLPDADATRFFEEIERHGRLLAEAGDVREDVDELFRTRFRGSKCVAGVVALGTTAIERALALPDRLATAGGDATTRRALAAGLLINRFRFSYVRQLSFAVSDVYVPARRWESLSRAHARSFAEIVLRELGERHAADLGTELAAAYERDLGGADRVHTMSLPPIGLYAFMRAKPYDGRVGLLQSLHEAAAEFPALIREFWSTTRDIEPPDAGWIALTGDRSIDAESERIDGFLRDRFGRLDAARVAGARAGNASMLRKFATPIVDVGAASLTAFGCALCTGDLLLTVGSAGTFAGSHLFVKHLLARERGTPVAHVDEYRALDAQLHAMANEPRRLARLETQVEQLLGRRLVAG